MKKVFKTLVILIFIFSTTGCWNFQELNQLAIITGMAIDKDEDHFEVSVLVANSKKFQVSSKEGESQTTVYSGKGTTISEAMKDIDLSIPKQLYIGHLSVIIIDEEIAKTGMNQMIDYLLRDPESTKRFYLAVAKNDKAKDILKTISPLESFPSQNLSANIARSSESQAVSATITYSKFVETMIKVGYEPILPTITLKGNKKKGSKDSSVEQTEPSAIIELDTLALFINDKFKTYATKNESRGINMLSGRINEMIVPVECDDMGNKAVIAITDIKTSIKAKVKNNEPIVNINIKAQGSIRELNCRENLYDDKNIKQLENLTKKEMKKLINKGINLAQENETDIFGFGNLIYKNNPKYFKSIKKTWNKEQFKSLKPNIKIKLNLEDKGSLEQTIKEANKS